MNKSNYETEEKNMFVKEFLSSGKTRVDFCKEKGISKSSLYRWTNEYQAMEPEEIVFLPLMKRQESITPPHTASNDSPEIHLEVGIFHCYIKEQISSSFLRQVLEEVKSHRCELKKIIHKYQDFSCIMNLPKLLYERMIFVNLQPNFNTNKLNKQEVSKQWMEEIGHLLPKKLEELASSTDTIQRKRGIKSACDLLKILLLYAVSGMNFKFLALCADALGISSISDTAWCKKMQTAGKWLKEILDQLLHGMATPDLSPSCTGRDVYLIDGPPSASKGKAKSRYVSTCLTI